MKSSCHMRGYGTMPHAGYGTMPHAATRGTVPCHMRQHGYQELSTLPDIQLSVPDIQQLVLISDC